MNFTNILKNNNVLITNIWRSYAFKSDLKIKWIRPEKVPSYKAEKSGDLKPMLEIDKNEILLEYRDSKELESANDLVRRLFTVEFAPRKKMTELYKKMAQDSVCNHVLDVGSLESRIAKWTASIRSMQAMMEVYPRNKLLKVTLKELIDKRKKYLKKLRAQDYKKFEWLLEKLDIVYKPTPEIQEQVTRKGSLRKLTDIYCENVKKERLEEYRIKLEEQQPVFLEEKLNVLNFIRDEQQNCGVEVTITQEEIDAVKQKLEEIKAKKQVEE